MRFKLITSTAALCLFAISAQAKEPFKCTLDKNYCTPFMGCIDTNSILFIGFTFGKAKGKLVARTNTDATCVGTWRRTALGLGKAKFKCDDGRSGRVTYSTLHRTSGTAIGRGRTNKREKVDVWAGHRILEYFARDESIKEGVATCGTAIIPSS